MSNKIIRTLTALLITLIIMGAGCAGKDKPSPTDVEAQAFNDLRGPGKPSKLLMNSRHHSMP